MSAAVPGPARLLVVDDDRELREALCDTLGRAGYRVTGVGDGSAALDELRRASDVGLIVSDVQMKPMDGLALLAEVRDAGHAIPVLLMTAFASVQHAVRALKAGAEDYLVKPFDPDELLDKVAALISDPGAARAATGEDPPDGPVARDRRMRELLRLAERVANTDATVLLSGESGTGKEVLARFIHRHSSRAHGPFVAINCAAIPENMLEAVLFGHERGAFTGAIKASVGKFEQAQGGTLLLDEISEMDLALQSKLLRVLQEREVERVGGSVSVALDVRVLATTNRRLREEVAAGRFREDLFYRLNVFPLHLPPLRERRDDIVPLAERLLQRHQGAAGAALAEDARAKLQAHAWPGNVRELDNVLQRALILAGGATIDSSTLQFEAEEPPPAAEQDLHANLRAEEHRRIAEVLADHAGNRTRAAELLGISQRTLRYKLAQMRADGVEIPVGAARG